MGPGVGGSTYQDALERGPAPGRGLLHRQLDQDARPLGTRADGRAWPQELTRDSLWDAFRNRRVYGVTGDRIELDFTCNGAPMGSILPAAPQNAGWQVSVRGADAIDRIELLRNDRVIATHSHQGTWQHAAAGHAHALEAARRDRLGAAQRRNCPARTSCGSARSPSTAGA